MVTSWFLPGTVTQRVITSVYHQLRIEFWCTKDNYAVRMSHALILYLEVPYGVICIVRWV